MEYSRAVAIVGVGAILPDAPNAPAFWQNICSKRYSIAEVPSDRWDIAAYYDPDPAAPDKTYSKIGGWVREFEFDWKRFRVPPKVAAAMDEGQQWAVTIAAEALADYGYPNRPLDLDRTGVILGTAMGGEMHYRTTLRISYPEMARALASTPTFDALPQTARAALLDEWRDRWGQMLPPITEDTMPGELPNIVSGRVANVLNLRGPNFITDAACASSFAAIDAAVETLVQGRADAIIAGGVDRNMGAAIFVKFCKIGALSATGSRPFGEGADGFVMGEGCAAFLLKRLADAERDGDRIYAVIRGVGASSDGKGKGITAPNPAGQVLAVRRAWENAGLDPATATLVEAHGTSTRVGDVAEVESLAAVFGGAPRGRIALGSAKSNIGHLKAGAGAAGLLKTAMALHHHLLPPTLNAQRPNPAIDFACTPFFLNHELQEWPRPKDAPRRAGVSAYGFGGTNFHLVLEEYVPGLAARETVRAAGMAIPSAPPVSTMPAAVNPPSLKPPVRGILALAAATPGELVGQIEAWLRRAAAGETPARAAPDPAALAAPERLLIDFEEAAELADRLGKARQVFEMDNPLAWRAIQAQGIFRGSGPRPGKLAFLFPGQGSQYANMGRALAAQEPVVAQVFAEADRVMTPILGQPLTRYIFVDSSDPAALQQAERDLTQTAITQPAVLTLDMALAQLLGEYGFAPDMVMGHSLGEYGALIAAGIMPFADALEAAAARGAEMTRVSMEDNGWMAAVFAPLEVVQATLEQVDGYVVAANINSYGQAVIGGASQAVEEAIQRFTQQGFRVLRLPVSHAFHTQIVAPASKPLRQVLDRLHIAPPRLPVVANVTGDFYPTTVAGIKDMLERQIASPVQWVQGLETLYNAGVRTFVEVGPKKALKGFVDDVLGDRPGVWSLFTNHPKVGELQSLNHALCGLYAAGYGAPSVEPPIVVQPVSTAPAISDQEELTMPTPPVTPALSEPLGQAVAQAIQQWLTRPAAPAPFDRNETPPGSVVISGTGLGLPGANKPVMDPDNALRILRGEQFVDLIPERFRQAMVDRRVTRLVKGDDGSGHFEVIDDTGEVVKLAGRAGSFDLSAEYGVPDKLVDALDITTQLAMAAGLDALREAGIPLVPTFRLTSKGTYLPDRRLLPEPLRDETGVIFASAFPGGDRFAGELRRYFTWQNRLHELELIEDLRGYTQDPATLAELARRAAHLRETLEAEPYTFDRRFVFRILAMGHSQFAEYIGARGPNTHVNAACAATTQALALAEDWIRDGRCRRVIVIAADNVTSDNLMAWIGAGFLAVGAVATDDRVDQAALPFDRRRHGTLLGMGACALVVESEDAVRERGMRGLAELLNSEIANSAYHGTRLDVDHISQVMDRLVTAAERRFGISRSSMAAQTVFMSHETYTPARGGSAAAEVAALRNTFGDAASEVIVANTKGFTGHAMGAGIEDVVAVKILEHGIVPPVPNFREADPELGTLNLSRGGRYPVLYALHLAAGFGSQLAMTLLRRIPGGLDRVDQPLRYRRWLADVSGYDQPETEICQRVLTLRAMGMPDRPPVPSHWQPGTGPSLRAAAPGRGAEPQPQPRPAYYPPTTPGSTDGSPVSVAPVFSTQPPAAPDPVPAPPPPAAVPPAPEAPPAPAAGEALPVGDAPAAPLPAAPAGSDPVATQVLAIVAEKTGYPVDMLALDLDLEADLGIDTVKQAETFATIRERFEIPQQEGLNLRDYPTLAAVIDFVRTMRPDLGTPTPPPDPTPVSAPVPEHTPVQGGDDDPVTAQVLAIVAEKTGYPADMLELDLDLEADLGIDTVKQAETFAAIRERFDIPLQEGLNLRDYPTLAAVIQFVHEMSPDSVATPFVAAPPTAASAAAPAAAPAAPIADLADADALPRRVPVAALRPALALCKPTGVALDASSRVLVMLDQGGVGKALVTRLEKRGVNVLALDPPDSAAELEAHLQSWLAEGPIQGVYWLPALDVEPPLEAMDADTWRALNRIRIKYFYTAMRALYASVRGPGRFLIAATRLGGLHGYGEAGASAPLGGAVSGFAKAYDMEQRLAGAPCLVKVVDFEPGRKTAEPADQLIAETLADPGAVEVGYAGGLRFGVTLVDQSVTPDPSIQWGPETVFLVTGAAGGITSAIVADLAAASSGIFYLLDVTPAPAADDAEIALLRRGPEALKQHLIEAARAAGDRPTPAAINRKIAEVERRSAALAALEAVQAAGGTAHYFSLDLRDGDAVAAVIDTIRSRHGRLDVLIHAAGLLVDRTLPDKEPAQFDLVFDVKADGFYHLLHVAQGLPIGAAVAFSSVAGRFGNNGQTDYSAANDLLCKLTSSLRAWRPDTRGLVIDWTAWADIGMAARGSVAQIMDALGVDMLPPAVGIPTVRRELLAGSRGEVVVAGRLGPWLDELDPTGGLDTEKAQAALSAHPQPPLMVGRVTAAGRYSGITAETILDPKVQPFLYDHAPDPGVPWLPGVMALEAMAAAAALFAPGYTVAAVEAVRMLGAFKFFRMEPRTLYLHSQVMAVRAGELVAHVVLRSRTPPAREGLPARSADHFQARVRLVAAPPAVPRMAFAPPADLPIPARRIYDRFFHGPAYQVIECGRVEPGSAVARLRHPLPPDTQPAGAAWRMAPRLVEACLQTAALWSLKQRGTMALPAGMGRVSVYRQLDDAGDAPLYAVVRPAADGAAFAAQVVDAGGQVYVALEDLVTVARP